MLGGAAAADTEVRAARHPPSRSLIQKPGGATEIEVLAAGHDLHRRAFAGERAFDEDDLAVRLARDAATLDVEPRDVEDQFFQSDRNSCQCGWFCFSMKPRRSAVSRSYCSRLSAQRISWKRRYSR
jgi:hypothetical protein